MTGRTGATGARGQDGFSYPQDTNISSSRIVSFLRLKFEDVLDSREDCLKALSPTYIGDMSFDGPSGWYEFKYSGYANLSLQYSPNNNQTSFGSTASVEYSPDDQAFGDRISLTGISGSAGVYNRDSHLFHTSVPGLHIFRILFNAHENNNLIPIKVGHSVDLAMYITLIKED